MHHNPVITTNIIKLYDVTRYKGCVGLTKSEGASGAPDREMDASAIRCSLFVVKEILQE